MKSIEEKAKAYDKIMDRAIKELNACGSQDCDAARQLFRLFPELEESEDERIRKWLIGVLSTYEYDKNLRDAALAWLEKQGEGIDYANKEYWRGYNEGKQVILDKYAELEKQCVQKPTDKVEPKFHEGEWVVLSISDGEKVVQIDSIEYFKSGEPRYITSGGRWFGNGTKAHLLTINNAKVEQKSAWSEEDETGLTNTIIMLKEGASLHFIRNDITKAVDWLKSLKDRYTWKPSKEELDAVNYILNTYTPAASDNRAWESLKILEMIRIKISKL